MICTISYEYFHDNFEIALYRFSQDCQRDDNMGEIPHRLSYARYQSKPLISIAVEVVDESSLAMTWTISLGVSDCL